MAKYWTNNRTIWSRITFMSFLLNEVESGFEPVTTCIVANGPTKELPILDFYVSKLMLVQPLRLPDERAREGKWDERKREREADREKKRCRERWREIWRKIEKEADRDKDAWDFQTRERNIYREREGSEDWEEERVKVRLQSRKIFSFVMTPETRKFSNDLCLCREEIDESN